MTDVSFGPRWFSCLNDEKSYTNFNSSCNSLANTHTLFDKEGFPLSKTFGSLLVT